jgi:DUF1365 family protein
MNSRLLTGRVWHRRSVPKANEFQYAVLYVDVDLAELHAVDQLRLFGYERWSAYSMMRRDHHLEKADNWGAALLGVLEGVTDTNRVARLSLIAQPSAFGYVFNPVSFYVARDAGERIVGLIAEVHNRNGQRHIYPLAPEGSATGYYEASFDKVFYVSPYVSMEARYDFRMRERGDLLSLGFDLHTADGLVLETALDLRSHRLDDANLAKALITHPLTPQRTLALIHWQALKLKLRGLGFMRPAPVRGSETDG